MTDYDYLRNNLERLENIGYQDRYRGFWQMNLARLSPEFRQHYFATLKAVLEQKRDISEIAATLSLVDSNAKGAKLQFSFASKLLHMVDPHAPIYDKMVASFFFFREPDSTGRIGERIPLYAAFHRFLTDEYRRVLDQGLLTESIGKFRERFKPKTFTNEKIIDSLIWSFVSLQKSGAAIRGEVTYC